MVLTAYNRHDKQTFGYLWCFITNHYMISHNSAILNTITIRFSGKDLYNKHFVIILNVPNLKNVQRKCHKKDKDQAIIN